MSVRRSPRCNFLAVRKKKTVSELLRSLPFLLRLATNIVQEHSMFASRSLRGIWLRERQSLAVCSAGVPPAKNRL